MICALQCSDNEEPKSVSWDVRGKQTTLD